MAATIVFIDVADGGYFCVIACRSRHVNNKSQNPLMKKTTRPPGNVRHVLKLTFTNVLLLIYTLRTLRNDDFYHF